MGNLSNYAAEAILEGTAIPATLYVQGHVGDPGPNGTANVAAETARQAFTRTAASVGAGAATNGNAAMIEWLNAAATEDWDHVTVWDASSGGNCWAIGQTVDGAGAPADVVIEAGMTVQIDIGDLSFLAAIWT